MEPWRLAQKAPLWETKDMDTKSFLSENLIRTVLELSPVRVRILSSGWFSTKHVPEGLNSVRVTQEGLSLDAIFEIHKPIE